MAEHVIIKGGSFLLNEASLDGTFTPEDFREEHHMIISITDDFVKREVEPQIAQIEHKDFEVIRSLMRKAGEMGLLGADVDEEYGGSGMSSIASIIIADHVGGTGSFGATLSVHSGIGTLPLVFFGNKEQRAEYLPPLIRGEKIGAYALTEPKAGSDALSIETRATLSPDGQYYILDGVKQFITNGGLADTFFTYAMVDGDKMTAFVVDREFEGVSTGTEESKLGIRGTSTVNLFLDGARVPAGNVVFEIGKGHHVAFNILNIGRFKVAAGCVGMAKRALGDSVVYATERVQFGKPICQFGLIKHKIAEMATKTYMAESMIYRTAGLIDTVLASGDRSADDICGQSVKQLSEYAIECSINKVFCSEILAYVTDEALQIHGGYGYCEDYPAERLYRDCRIFRIYEGTNEMNRVIIATWLARKAVKGELPLLPESEELAQEILGLGPLTLASDDGSLEYQRKLLERAKKVFLFVFNAAMDRYGEAVAEQQEVLGLMSDIAIEVYALESGLVRALKSTARTGGISEVKMDMVRLYAEDAVLKITNYARQALAAVETGEELDSRLEALGRLTQFAPVDSVRLRARIADHIINMRGFAC